MKGWITITSCGGTKHHIHISHIAVVGDAGKSAQADGFPTCISVRGHGEVPAQESPAEVMSEISEEEFGDVER